MKLSRLVTTGYFNIHINDDSDFFARAFISIMSYQHAYGPTHTRGDRLELVCNLSLNVVCSRNIFISDDHCVLLKKYITPLRLGLKFLIVFLLIFFYAFNLFLSPYNNVNPLIYVFNSHCLISLDKVCPVKNEISAVFKLFSLDKLFMV